MEETARLQRVLEEVASGVLSPQDAVLQLKQEPFQDLGYAKVDFHRSLRQGSQEVIYGAGKTTDQIIGILRTMETQNCRNVLVTRLPEAAAQVVSGAVPMDYHKDAKIGVAFPAPHPALGKIVIVTGGTSDIPVAEEAAVTAECLGNHVVRLYDVGVAGIHRLLAHVETIMNARVIIAIAGMEGALASVIGGLADCPVIAVPTSVGYGTALGGVTALLSMLNSCASGVSVVNIDNGFGAGYQANLINNMEGGK